MSDINFISQLIKNKEDLNLIFISDFDSQNILQSICGFLNDEGGWILIGHNGKRSVSSSLQQADIENLRKEINSHISPQPLVYITNERDGVDDVTLVNVLKGQRQPYTFNRKYFVYKKNEVRLANPDDVSLLLRQSNEYSSTWEKSTLSECSINDLSIEEIRLTINAANKLSKDRSLPDNPEEFLNYFQLADFGNIKNGALVLFGNDPIRFIPQCRIRITVLPEGKTGDAFDDIRLIETNLFDAFNQVSDYFKKFNPLQSIFRSDDWNRDSEYKFPEDALDEAIVNAMVHRDYSDVSGEITINIYPNRIEIINSGEIPSDIIRGKNKIKPHHSIFRNPIIAHMFFIRGKMEKVGRGLSLIYNRFVDMGYRKPEWTSQNGYTTLSLFSEKLVINLNKRMQEFLNTHSDESFIREDYEKFFDNKISEKTARNDLSKLVEGGYLDKIGKGPNTSYLRK